MLIVILLAYLSMPLMAMLNLLSMQLSENHVNTMMLEMMENPYWVNLFFVAILPAISEEFIFRGVIFHSYREAGILKGAIFSGILFGLIHLNLNQFSYAFVMGIIFALLIEATGSIFAPIIFHFIINGNSITLATLSMKLMSPEEITMMGDMSQTQVMGLSSESMGIIILMGVIVVFLISFLAILVYIWLAKRSGRISHIKNLFKKKEKSIERIMDIPLLIGILGCILFIILTEIG
ncbi:MAG: CPBP family intramembrane metalloprotease [Clostridiales bacterium]|nr:CPBP family intramembrane metalloprotease [Clostridiales bacterium]